MLRTLKSLCLLNGISGNEDEVREYIKARALKYTDDVRTDRMGNLIVVKHAAGNCCAPAGQNRCAAPGQNNGQCGVKLPKLMIAAHMDEVGFMVTRVTEKGYLGFA